MGKWTDEALFVRNEVVNECNEANKLHEYNFGKKVRKYFKHLNGLNYGLRRKINTLTILMIINLILTITLLMKGNL